MLVFLAALNSKHGKHVLQKKKKTQMCTFHLNMYMQSQQDGWVKDSVRQLIL